MVLEAVCQKREGILYIYFLFYFIFNPCIVIYLKNFFCSSTLFCLFLPPLPTTPAIPTSVPCSTPSPLVIAHVSFVIVPVSPSLFPPLSPPLSTLVTVSLFSISYFKSQRHTQDAKKSEVAIFLGIYMSKGCSLEFGDISTL